MSTDLFVVDASVAIKWFVPEIHTAAALRFRDSTSSLHVPAFFGAEMGNIFWKKVRRTELTTVDAVEMVRQLLVLPLTRHPDQSLVLPAFELACATGHTVYDCLYLALAIRLGGRMVTADRRLVNGLAATPYAAHLCWVEDLP